MNLYRTTRCFSAKSVLVIVTAVKSSDPTRNYLYWLHSAETRRTQIRPVYKLRTLNSSFRWKILKVKLSNTLEIKYLYYLAPCGVRSPLTPSVLRIVANSLSICLVLGYEAKYRSTGTDYKITSWKINCSMPFLYVYNVQEMCG